MDPQGHGGLGMIAVVLLQHPLDETLFKFRNCVGVKNIAVNHLVNQGFKLVFHGSTPVRQDSSGSLINFV